MVFKGAVSFIARLSRAFKPIFTSRIYQISKLNKTTEIYSKYSTRFYLFPSIYRSFLTPLNGQNLSNLIPSRVALNEIKRRLFFAGLYRFDLFDRT
jgi:hypothetical protein